jgi:MFS family permease
VVTTAPGARRSRRLPQQLPRRLAFANASCAITLVFAAAGAPAPLYAIYADRFEVTSTGVTGSYAAYILAAATSMLCGGRLSDVLGRRSVVLATMLTSLLACVVLLEVRGAGLLVTGRILQGLAIGTAMSSIGAYVVDLRAPGTEFMASLVASAAPTVGVALGALASGALVEYAPAPTTLVYLVFVALLATCACGVAISAETVALTPSRSWAQVVRSLVPRLAIPVRKRPLFVGVIGAFVASWTLGGLYQSLGPEFGRTILGQENHVFAGITVASVLGCTGLGGPLTRRLSPRQATLVGLVALGAGTAVVLVALRAVDPVLFVAASAVAGTGFGAATTGSMRALLHGAAASEVAGLLSAVYLISYVGAAVPALVGGRLVPHLGLLHTAYCYAALVGVLALVAAVIAAARAGGTHATA